MDQQQPSLTINCSHPKQAKKAPGNEASDSYYYFENMVEVTYQK